MWEMIERMATDRLWIYTAIAGSLFGAAFLAWFQGTRIGIWAYVLFDNFLNRLVERWGWTWFKTDENAWRKKYPHVTKKIDDLDRRLKKLETKPGDTRNLKGRNKSI